MWLIMYSDLLLLVVWLFTFAVTNIVCQSQSLTRYNVKNDVTIQSRLASLTALSPLHCFGLCSRNADCHVFSYDTERKQCILHALYLPVITTVGYNLHTPFRCYFGWIEHGTKCYQMATTATDWYNSLANCQNLGADLVKIEDAIENDFIESEARAGQVYCLWLGGRYYGEIGAVRWNDLTDFVFHDFQNPSVTSWNGCIDMVDGPNYRWNVHTCSFAGCLGVCAKDAP